MSVEAEELAALAESTGEVLDDVAPTLLTECAEAVTETLLWLRHFDITRSGSSATELLRGCHSAVLEAAALVSLGLARPALSAIRLQSELLLGHIYFRNHPEEWDRVCATGDGFMLEGAVIRYQMEADKGLQGRLKVLENRGEPDIRAEHRFLSAHVHGQSPLTAPDGEHLASVCVDEGLLREVVLAQARASRALSNYLVALLAPRWMDLPPLPVRRVSEVLEPRQRAAFFGGETARTQSPR